MTGRSYGIARQSMEIMEKKSTLHVAAEFTPHRDGAMWYVLFVRSNQEKRVALGLSDRGIEHLLPCYTSLRQWKDRRVPLNIPLFPGYLFVHLPFSERMQALTIPSVVSLIGKKDAPTPVSDEEIAWIRKGAEHGHAAPHPRLEAGQRVLITSGPMTGLQGILLREQNQSRVVISIDSIWRAFVVDVDAACVEPVRNFADTNSLPCYRKAMAGPVTKLAG